jgi:cellulose synthase/poly-beta-1,6-N-acetylglucosamine synthase-like glycosyltransferase
MTAEPSESMLLPAAELEFDYTGDLALGRTGLRPGHPRVSVVVPAKNEAANIRAILPYLSNCFEVVVVLSKDDDDSARAAREALPSAKVVYQRPSSSRYRVTNTTATTAKATSTRSGTASGCCGLCCATGFGVGATAHWPRDSGPPGPPWGSRSGCWPTRT